MFGLFHKPTRHERAQANIKRAIMLSRLPRPQATASLLPAEPSVRRIEVKAGSLGTLHHYAIRIPVRVVRTVKIEVRHEN